jgi:hypothetical protein
MIWLDTLAAYGVIGAVIAVAFVVLGISRVLPHVSVTPGARVLLVPGAIVFWPLVLARCLKPRKSR